MSERTRCAIYTRKSSEEGLEQAFNSLHAQREACEAYVKSQRHEGWLVLSTIYDDGGVSGGSMERPALRRLLQDICDRKVDVVVVYKIDRLTRSLFDFAKIVEIFDGASTSFVSVTQSFNTTTSMGRLTLNVLLSFAQFEREVTGERIRDKIAASRRKGMFMGGNVPLGYDLIDHRLIINNDEAKTVRTVFDLYLKLGSVRLVKAELDLRGLQTKRRASRSVDGLEHSSGGASFGIGHIYYLLKNPVYVGSVRHKGTVHPGRHEAIVGIDIWNAVQAQLASNGVERERQTERSESTLVGRVFDASGNRLTPAYTVKGSRRYRYYVTVGSSSLPMRVSAADLEHAVIDAIISWLRDFTNIAALTKDRQQAIQAFERAQELSVKLARKDREAVVIVHRLLRRVDYGAANLAIHLNPDALADTLGIKTASGTFDAPLIIEQACTLARRGKANRLVIDSAQPQSYFEPTLATAILRAQSWFEALKDSPSRVDR